MPVTSDSSPWTSAVSVRTCEAVLTPSTFAICSPSAAPKDRLSPGSRMYGASTWSVTAPSTEERSPAPSTATTVTSVSPIISAAAVDAVRLGLRTAFALASSPDTPPVRRPGQPTRRASGFTSLGAASATPMNSPITPRPSSRTTPSVPTLANTPSEIAATEATMTPSASFAECAARRLAGSSAPSRTAAIGGTRVARRAGRMLAISVTTVPSSSETTIVRVAMTVPDFGRSAPSATNRALRPL